MNIKKNKIGALSDKELAALFSDNERCEIAFAELYSRYSQRVYAYCLRVTGDHDDAGDIFQETFLHFFNAAKKLEAVDNVKGLIFKIARNLCLNFKRDKKNNVSIDDLQFLSEEDTSDRQEMLNLITMALDTLPFVYKEAFILRQYQGYSYKEIAEISDDSIPAVKNRVWRAKEKIKQILAPYLKEFDLKYEDDDNKR